MEYDVNRELGKMVKDMMEGTVEELKGMIPGFDLSPKISDVKIEQAIMELPTKGMLKLFQQFGQRETVDYISRFGRGRKW